ncbi:hypothetical protein E2C01_056883 [Portunus trituberculatus]|uniref:Uncharacterized protein n=1 Tax=Portunus trituberculatus TaxID=210409 RepID=A0A5B7GYL4_PORTR|nr:hypothetical protein [Portunus trituberculatus]
MGDTKPSDSNFEYLPGDDNSDDSGEMTHSQTQSPCSVPGLTTLTLPTCLPFLWLLLCAHMKPSHIHVYEYLTIKAQNLGRHQAGVRTAGHPGEPLMEHKGSAPDTWGQSVTMASDHALLRQTQTEASKIQAMIEAAHLCFRTRRLTPQWR